MYEVKGIYKYKKQSVKNSKGKERGEVYAREKNNRYGMEARESLC